MLEVHVVTHIQVDVIRLTVTMIPDPHVRSPCRHPRPGRRRTPHGYSFRRE